MRLNASYRLHATANDHSDDETEVTAEFDQAKEPELKEIQLSLRRHGVIFRLDRHHLFHKSNKQDFVNELQIVLKVLDEAGYKVRVVPGILARPTFALKCQNDSGLVCQRINTDMRIFFSK